MRLNADVLAFCDGIGLLYGIDLIHQWLWLTLGSEIQKSQCLGSKKIIFNGLSRMIIIGLFKA